MKQELCSVELAKLSNEVKDKVTKNGYKLEELYDTKLSNEQILRYNQLSQSGQDTKQFLKTFLFSASINLNDWGVTLDSLHKNIYSFIGKPIVLYFDELEQIFSHPDSGKPVETEAESMAYYENYRVGTIVDVFYDKNKRAYYAISEITDPIIKKLFNENKLPLFVSPGIGHYDGPALRKSNWVGYHLAIVSRPAFGVQFANITGICNGEQVTCKAQLATASINVQKSKAVDTIAQKEQFIHKYLDNYDKMLKHNIINFNTQNETISNNKMSETTQQEASNIKTDNSNYQAGNIQQNQNQNKQDNPSKLKFDVNMCIASMVERGLDPNTSSQLCMAMDNSLGAGGGLQGGGGAGFATGYEVKMSPEFYNTVANTILSKNATIHGLNTKVRAYETQFKETLGLDGNEDSFKVIKEWQKTHNQAQYDIRKKEYTDFLKLYSTNEEQIQLEAEEYIKSNVPIESVKNIYSKRQTLEELQKQNSESKEKEAEKQTEANKAKPHETYNNLKEGQNIDTQDNRKTAEKATASVGNKKIAGNALLYETMLPLGFDNNESNTSYNNGGAL